MKKGYLLFNLLFLLLVLCVGESYAQPCQTIIPTITSTSPAAVNSIIRICKDQTVTVSGSSTFSAPNGGAGATYAWSFGDGGVGVGTSASHTYTTGGIFTITFVVTDVNNCSAIATMEVYVPKDPIFAGTSVSLDTVCPGNPVNLTGVVNPVKVKKECTNPIADTVFLPDGNGVSYISTIDVTCFNPGQTVTSPTDIEALCMNIEHSYLGDLDMVLFCPNGSSAILKEYPGGGVTFLGEPNDPGPGNNIPGIGYTYCFANSATWGTMVSMIPTNTVPVTGMPPGTPGNAMIEGTYTSYQSFNNFIGCPLNGTWTLEITDNLLADNGYVFYWQLNFNPLIVPSYDSFTPVITSASWQNDPSIISNGINAVAYPTEAGIKCYTFSVTDDFGCSYDTSVCLYVKERPISNFYGEICPGGKFMGHNIPGTYTDTLGAVNGCDSIVIIKVVANPFPDVTLKGSTDVEICEGSGIDLELKNPEATTTYQWYKNGAPLPGETNYKTNVTSPGAYHVVAVSDKGCEITSAQFFVKLNPNPVAEIQPISGELICAFDTLELKALAGPGYDYRWEPGRPFRIITGADGQIVKGVFVDPVTEVVLTVYNQFGCYDMDTLVVPTKPCCEVFIPNAFSPNNDGNNDYFNPVLQPGQILLELKIFDRYGKLVYNNSNIKKGWDGRYEDGTEASTDTYMYYAKYTCADGKLYEKRESVSLLR
jgi:gliding motility-associated-like protein